MSNIVQITPSEDLDLVTNPRYIHSSRNVENRLMDEISQEPIVSEDKWITDPDDYDLKCIDTPIDKSDADVECYIDTSRNGNSGEFVITILDKGNTLKGRRKDIKGTEKVPEPLEPLNYVCDRIYRGIPNAVFDDEGTFLDANYSKNDGLIYLDTIYNTEERKGKCYFDFLMRSFLDVADKNDLVAFLVAQPFMYNDKIPWGSYDIYEYTFTPEELEDHKNRIQRLVNLYAQYGFQPVGELSEHYFNPLSDKPIERGEPTPILHQAMIRDPNGYYF